ncbi:MAG TPA: hypothetical protein VKZ79_11680 [Alphaproteobacteria bacterium]|nr:hypothetical protein [Alphaproteobacteria bacterium]
MRDGSDGTPPTILVHSAIRRGDAAAFEAAFEHVRGISDQQINGVPFVTVELDSPGGDAIEALEIGRLIYQHFMMTLVRSGQECVSACVFLLVAGAVHTPADGASVGIHKPLLVSWSGMTSQRAHQKYDELMEYIRDYFGRLGVSPAIYDAMMGTSSFSMRYFAPSELDRFGLRGEDPAWEKLYRMRWAAESQPLATISLSRVGPPKLASVDQSLRDMIFMPGAYHAGEDYLAGAHLPTVHFTWQTVDSDETHPAAQPGLEALWAIMSEAVHLLIEGTRPVWILSGLLAFELLRNRRHGIG